MGGDVRTMVVSEEVKEAVKDAFTSGWSKPSAGEKGVRKDV